ncbi:MAG TPA: zinc-dependent alcohol dehydrogenase family protein [Nitrospiria bacterium]
MRAMILAQRAPMKEKPLRLIEKTSRKPQKGEVLIEVAVCAICRTDLHIIEGDLPPHQSPVVPGHQVVGYIRQAGTDTHRFKVGDRVGVAWLFSSCGRCLYCHRDEENLCENPVFTGYDVDGGYSEFLIAKEDFIYPIPPELPSKQAAPLLCAGIIGYRALHRTCIRKGERLGLYGFGASAHVVIQIARHWGCQVYVATRGEKHRELALQLGAHWVGGATDRPPEKLNAAILFAPVGELVPVALEALDKGGTLALAGVYLTDIPSLNYEQHLFHEKNLISVTANTRQDGEALLHLAEEIPIQTHTETFMLHQANEALLQLKEDGIQGAGVLEIKREK